MPRTVMDLVNRCRRDWLTPADERPITSKLTADISKSTTSLNYDPLFLLPEELEFIGTGTTIEIGREQMVVGGVNESTNTFSNLIRGSNGTTAYAHKTNDEIVISPTWSLVTVYEAIVDSILQLYPDLYRVYQVGPERGNPVELPHGIDTITRVYSMKSGGVFQVQYQFNEYDPNTNSPSIYTNTSDPVYVTGLGRFTAPVHENVPLSELKVEREWEQLIIVGALKYLIGKEDFDDVTVESIGEALDQQAFPTGQASSMRNNLISYYEYLLARARRIQLNKYSTSVVQTWGG